MGHDHSKPAPSGGSGGGSGGSCKPLPVPKYPDQALMPAPPIPPPEASHKVLRQVCDKDLSAGPFSVTLSPMPCPVGAGKNELYTLRPYWWETSPGRWERRDGHRNPECAKPQSQKQLQEMARAVQTLAYGATCLPKANEYAAQAAQLLKVFFLDPETRMMPEVRYAQCVPSENKGDKKFAVALRYIVLVDQALLTGTIPAEVAQGVRDWIAVQAKWMAESEQGAEARSSGNNITLWYHAIYASHLAVIDPASAPGYIAQTIGSFPTDAARFFAPELERTRPRHYVLFSLEALFIIAGAAGVPSPDILQRLAAYIDWARTVQCGGLEVECDNDQRAAAKLSFFERQLDRWTGKDVPCCDPDGKPWEGGWNQRSRLMWSMI